MQGERVLVNRHGAWLPGTVLWEYLDGDRKRALVRIETDTGLVARELHWCDTLCRGRILELPLRRLVDLVPEADDGPAESIDLRRPAQKVTPSGAATRADQPPW